MPKDPPPPAAALPVDADTFAEEINAAKPDNLDWGNVTGEVQAVGSPPERFDLLPDRPLEDLAILFGRRREDEAKGVDLYNHAMSNLRRANVVTGPTRSAYLVEVARAVLILADE